MTADTFSWPVLVTHLPVILIFFFSVVLHECAHGWVAHVLGDPTAREAGRLTLNPLKHVDLLGTVVLPLALVLSRSPIVLGWAKPVPVSFSRLRHPKRDMMWVGLSGPATNILIAFLLSLVLRAGPFSSTSSILEIAIIINLVLAVFNLIPVPPLDGSRLVMGLLPGGIAVRYAKMERYGIAIVFLLLYFHLLDPVIWPLVGLLASGLGVGKVL